MTKYPLSILGLLLEIAMVTDLLINSKHEMVMSSLSILGLLLDILTCCYGY